ncbi:MAG: InlB B-repeat-containing protein, partial [Anaeroplasmataceae bacterium]|nr:InlB B-repeat-containing protein [Anaeroplasmataceae bacterium]
MMKFKKIILGLFTISAIVCFASCKTDDVDPNLPGDHEALEHIVTFDSMDGSKVDSQTVIRGTKATEPTAPTKEGYDFKGWYKDSSCTFPWEFDEDVVTGNVTLYAKWTEKQVTPPAKEYWTVTIDLNDGSTTSETKQVEKGQKLTGVTEPTREGYEFAGWK